MNDHLRLSTLGSIKNAKIVFQKMLAGSSAYRDFLKEQGIDEAEAQHWEQLPLLTKQNFYGVHHWKEILPAELFADIYSLYRSSGTTQSKIGNKGFFWPQLRSEDKESIPVMQKMLSEAFALDQKRSLVIIGLSLGSWAGGEQFSFLFKNLAYISNLPMVVFSPGNNLTEIIEIINQQEIDFEQILIAMCPSAIFYFNRLVAQLGIELPFKKITFVVTGEPFPEQMRLDLKKLYGQSMADMTIMSIYGSADSGFIGFESLPLIRLRQTLTARPDIAACFGLPPRSIPNLFHMQADETYYENIDGDLVITKWQGMPLVRYNIQDRVQFFSWKAACLLIAEMEPRRKSFWQHFSNLPVSDFMSITGRSSGCVVLGDTMIYATMLQDVLLQSSMSPLSTGVFVVWKELVRDQQVLFWQIELKPGVEVPSATFQEKIYEEFIKLVGEQQPEFLQDYQAFYKPFESEGLKIFRFQFCPSPQLSDNSILKSTFKQKIIIDHGPL